MGALQRSARPFNLSTFCLVNYIMIMNLIESSKTTLSLIGIGLLGISSSISVTIAQPPNAGRGGANVLDPVGNSVSTFGGIVNTLVAVVVSLAFLYFFWNLGQYVLRSGPEEKAAAKTNMIWAVVAMFVITSLWGLIAFIRGLVGVGDGTANNVKVPKVDFNR